MNWTFEITRQSNWDVWSWVCIAGALTLLLSTFFSVPWRAPVGWLFIVLIVAGVGGTIAVLSLPMLRRAGVGMIWTFALLAIVSTTFYLRLLSRLRGPKVAVLLALRVLALFALVPMLFEPVFSFTSKPTPQKPLLFVIDMSGSMSFPDMQNGPTRIQSAWSAIGPQLGKIREHFVPRFFTFDTEARELKSPDDLSRLPADGKATDIVSGLRQTLSHNTRDDAAVILISDGNDNTSADVLEQTAAMGRPVNTVLVGSDQAQSANIANIAVADVHSDEDFAVGHETIVTAVIQSTALADRVVTVKLGEVDDKGRPLGQQVLSSSQLILKPLPQGQEVKLTYKPATAGVHRLAVWVDPVPGERSTVDNHQEFQGLALDPNIKVLYIEGSVRPEYRELKHLLQYDPNIEMSSLLRAQSTKFIAFGTVDRQPLPPRIPTSAQEWKKFDVVILGDLDSSFLSQPQQTQIERFVGDGGALLMLGGERSFGPGGYKGTPIEKALPVFVGDLTSPQEADKFVPRLTMQGAAHPAMAGLDAWFGVGDKPPVKAIPPLNGNAVVTKERSGAQVLLIHQERPGPDGNPQIVLAVESYGKGRSAVLTAHSTYQWGMPMRGLGQDSPYNRLWGQLVRWLAGADVRNRQNGPGIDGLLNKTVFQLGENVHIRGFVRDTEGNATSFAQVVLKLKPAERTDVGAGAAQEQSFTLGAVEEHRGMYEMSLPHPGKGTYSATLVATKDGKELGRQAVNFTVIPPADELLKIAANPALMHDIAVQTRGSSYEIGQLSDLLDELIRSEPAEAKGQRIDVRCANFFMCVPALFGRYGDWPRRYDLPLQALIVGPLLLIEWALRRRWQLS